MATWNLRHCRDGLGAVAARIAALRADVVAVQEVDRGLARSGHVDQIAELARMLGWQYLFAPAIGDDEGERPAYGVGLLSRTPPGAAAWITLPVEGSPIADGEPRVVLRAAVPTALGEVQICVTHLSWVPWRAWRQLRSMLDLAGDLPGPTVVAGDLNLPARWLAAALAGTGWHPARAGATFPAHRPCMQLDHILVRDAQLGDVHVDLAGPSDHRLLRATVVVGGDHPSARSRIRAWELNGAPIGGGLVT